MGSGFGSCSGYTLEITKEVWEKFNFDLNNFGVKFFGETEWETEKNNWDSICDLLDFLADEQEDITFNVNGKEGRAFFFKYDSENGDRYDDLSDGIYLAFYEDSLYTRTYTELGNELSKADLFPVFARWVEFG